MIAEMRKLFFLFFKLHLDFFLLAILQHAFLMESAVPTTMKLVSAA